jgi:hypothetical protein
MSMPDGATLLSNDAVYLRCIVTWSKEDGDKEEIAWGLVQETKSKMDSAIGDIVRKNLGPDFHVRETRLSRGSIEVLVIIGTIGTIYYAVSKYKNFVESIQLLKTQLADLLKGYVDSQNNQSIAVTTTWTPGPALVRPVIPRRNVAQSFLLWCAGTDQDALINCPKSEVIKQAGYGSLVLIPAMLALISMGYAISTLTNQLYISSSIGLVWAIIVFMLDRFIVSTFRKQESIPKDLRSVSFIGRFLLAALIGLVIAHPLIMLIFDKSINAKLDDQKRAEEQRINKLYDERIEPFNQRKALLNDEMIRLNQDIKQKEDELRTEKNKYRRRDIKQIVTRRFRKHEDRNKQIQEGVKSIDEDIAKLQEERTENLREFSQPHDYLAKEAALGQLIDSSRTVFWTQMIIIGLFVLIDILPISFKVLTGKGTYDYVLESLNRKAIHKNRVDEESHAELLEKVLEYRKQKIHEIMQTRRQQLNVPATLDDDIDTILRQSVLWSTVPIVATERFYGIPPGNSESNTVMATHSGSEKLSDLIKKKVKDKSTDLILSLVCIPLQAVALFLYFVFSHRDIWQFISITTTFQVFVLFIFNFALNALLKLFVR